MTRVQIILSWTLAAGAVFPAMAAPGRYPISVEQVAATMGRMGIRIAPEQVTLLTQVVATTSAPRLVVHSVEPWSDGRLRARLECESPEQCLPFFVGLRVNGDQSQAAGAQTEAPAALSSSRLPKAIAIKNGDEAVLRLDSERVHIRLSVICLENGAQGQTIRVTSKDRKMTYRAQVVDGATLQGRL
jgi:hypothetical protein